MADPRTEAERYSQLGAAEIEASYDAVAGVPGTPTPVQEDQAAKPVVSPACCVRPMDAYLPATNLRRG